MNVAQELGDSDLYNYDVLIKLLGDRFDPASRVSASRSRFHARLRRQHEDADAFADALAELCRVGYPELGQELIAEQFVRGQSDPELKKYLWVVIRTQKDRKLQTLIEVCTYFSSLVSPTHLHRPAEQTFAVHQQAESCTEEVEDQENVFAVGDYPPWNRRSPDTSVSPSLQQMFVLARRMGYEMRPIAGQPDAQRRPPGNRPSPDQNCGFRPPARTGRDYSRIKCFSLAICRVVDRDRTPPYLLNQWDGTSNLTTGLHATATAVRETISRSGLYALHPALCHLRTSHRHRQLRHRISISYLFIHNRIHVQKHARPAFTGHRGTPVIC